MGKNDTRAAAFHPGDGPTPRTAADVLTTHARIGPRGQCRCGWYPAMRLNDTDADRRQHDQHQADMLTAGGLLATAEPQAAVDPVIRPVQAVGVARWLAEHDAEVRAQALRDIELREVVQPHWCTPGCPDGCDVVETTRLIGPETVTKRRQPMTEDERRHLHERMARLRALADGEVP